MNFQYKTTTLYEKAVHGMFAMLALLAVVYCVILLSLVFSVIERKQNVIASRDLSSQLSSLETRYANVVASINEKDLIQNGFSRVDGASFAVRKDEIASYTVLYAR
jgi:hypothetical protein